MTVISCPQGCGGVVDTAYEDWSNPAFLGVGVCLSCRRHVSEVQVPRPGMCWAWFGPPDHRMRCRRPVGHGADARPGTTWSFDDHDGHDCTYDPDEFDHEKGGGT
jgi:hypothetical protein